MHNQQQRYLKTNNIVSKFVVIVLSVVLLTGISLVPVLQIGVSAQQQQQPQPIIAIKITSPTTGQQVPTGELTISGTSTDNATSDCTVYADWNNTKPFQTATATGPGGANDYSRWTFTYTKDYHLITNGTNNLTSKLSCVADESNIGGSTANLTKSYSVNVIGVATTGAVSATKEQNYDSNVSPSSTYPPVMTENENNNTDATTTITTPPEEPTIYWDLDDIEEEDIDRDNKQVFELEDNIFGSPGLSEAFQCGYNLGLNNSSLTREQISEYCNNLILETENVDDLMTFGFGTIFIVIGS